MRAILRLNDGGGKGGGWSFRWEEFVSSLLALLKLPRKNFGIIDDNFEV